MAKTQTETKVIQVRFDNQKFEKKIQATIKSTEKLDKSLQFKGSKKGIEDLSKELDKLNVGKLDKDLEKTDKQLNNISVTLGSLLKIKLLSRAIDVVTNKFGNMLKTMTGINNIKDGWDAYNESLITTGGILNQVERDGYGLEDVANAMDKLRWYADETSYSFQTMSDGIRQFTIAGVDLEKATSAVQGVANLAGSAKVFDPYKVQSAMDAISKSMQTGYMDTLKWTTLTNTAGIVTKDFSEKLLEAAAAEGTLIKSQAGQYRTKKGGDVVTAENIRSTLSRRWLTQEVMTRVLGEYNSATEVVKGFMTAIEDVDKEAFKEISKSLPKVGGEFESLDELLTDIQTNTSKYSEETVNLTKRMNAENITTRQAALLLNSLGYEFDEVSYKAFLSSQETTSFGQAITYVSQAIKTTWQGTFQSMFGDVKESTALWSDVSDSLYGIFVTPFEHLEEQFGLWSELEEGGARDFREIVLNIVDVIGEFTNAAKKGFVEVFGTDFVGVLQKATKWLKGFTERLKENQTILNIIEAISKVIATVLKAIGKIAGGVFKIVSAALKAIEPIVEGISTVILWIADGIVMLINYLDELGVFEAIFGGIAKIFTMVGNAIKKISNVFKQSKAWGKIGQALSSAFKGLLWVINKIVEGVVWLIDKITSLFDATEDGEEKVSGLAKALDWLIKVFEKLAAPFKKIIEYFKQLDFKTAFKKSLTSIKDTIINVFGKIKEWFENSKFPTFLTKLKDALTPIGKVLVDIFHSLIDPLVAAAKAGDIKTILKWLAGVAGVIAMILFIKTQWDILHGATKVLSSMADMFWALEARFRASAIRSWGVLIISIGALLFLTVETLARVINLIKTELKEDLITAAVITFGYLALFFTAIIVMLKSFNKQAIFGIRSSILVIAMAGALALALKSMGTAIKMAKDISAEDLGKAIAIFVAVGLIFASILAAGRVGTRKLSPALITYAKIILAIWAFLKLLFWMLDNLSKYKTSTINAAVKIVIAFGAAIATIVAILSAASLIKKISLIEGKWKFDPSAGVTKPGFGMVGQIALMLIGIGVILAAIGVFLKLASTIPLSKLPYAAGIVATSLILVGGLAVTLMVIDRKIPMPIEATKASLKITGLMAAISTSVIAMIGALALASLIPLSTIKTGALRIAVLYLAVGAIAAGLLAIDKALAKSGKSLKIGKEGLSSTGFSKSNIGSAIFAITVSVAAMVLMLKYVANLDNQLFWEGTGKVLLLFACVSSIVAGLLILDKIGQGKEKSVLKPIGLVFAMTLLISVIVASLLVISNLLDHPFVALGVILGILGGIAMLLIVIGDVVKSFSTDLTRKGLREASVLMMTVATFIVIVSAALYIISNTLDHPFVALGLVLGIFAALGILMSGIGVLVKESFNTKVRQNGLKQVSTLILSIAIFLLFVASALWVISKIPEEDLIKTGIVASVIFATIAAIIYGIFMINKNLETIKKDVFSILGIVAGIEALLAGLIGLVLLARLVSPEELDSASKAYLALTEAVFMMGLMVATLGVIIHKKHDVLLGLVMMAGIEVLLAGLIGLTLLAQYATDTKIKHAKSAFWGLSTIVILMGAFVTALGAILHGKHDILLGLVMMAGIEALLAGLIGLVLLSNTVSDTDLGKAILIYLALMPAVLVMAGIVAAVGAIVHKKNDILLGLVMIAGIEILLAGLIGLIMLTRLVNENELNRAKATYWSLTFVVLAMSAMVAVLGKILHGKHDVLLGLVMMAGIEALLAGLIGLVILTRLVDPNEVYNALKVYGIMLAVVLGMGVIVAALGVLTHFLKGSLLALVMVAGIEALLAGLIGLILLSKYVTYEDAWNAVKIYGVMLLTVLAMGVLVAAIGVLVNFMPMVLLGLVMVLGIELLLAGLIGLIILAKLVSDDDLDHAEKVYSSMTNTLAVMSALVAIFGILVAVAGPIVLLGLAMMAGIELLIAGLVGLILLTKLVNDADIENAKNAFNMMEEVIISITVILTGMAILAPLIAPGMVVLAGIEMLLLGMVGIAALVSLVAKSFAKNLQKLSDALMSLGEAINILGNIKSSDLDTVKNIIETLEQFKDVKLKYSFIDGLTMILRSIRKLIETSNFGSLVENLQIFSDFITSLWTLFDKLQQGKDIKDNLSKYVQAIKDIAAEEFNFVVTLTPVWNFGADYYAGADMIANFGRTSYNGAYAAKNTHDIYRSGMQMHDAQDLNGYNNGYPAGMNVVINQSISDFTGGYRTDRATQNALSDAATNGSVSWAKNMTLVPGVDPRRKR